MKLIIFGATGGTGRCLAEQALAEGHAVTAFVRHAGGLPDHPRLTPFVGDALDARAVARAITGHDAVLCAIGAPALDRTGLRTGATRSIVGGMQEAGVHRLVCLSMMGLGEERRLLPFFLKYVLFPLYLRWVVRDHTAQEELILASGLDWTLVRPPTLTDGPFTGVYRHGFSLDDRDLQLSISRADVAHFMLRQLDDATYSRRASSVAYAKAA